MPSAKSSRRAIVRAIKGDRYLLTSRRIVQLDSADAQEGAPWYALNKDIRDIAEATNLAESQDYIPVRARTSKTNPVVIRCIVKIGRTSALDGNRGDYHLGCGYFDVKTFKRILTNAGVKTVRKAFAAKAGA